MRTQLSMVAIATLLAFNSAHAADLKSVAKTAIENNPEVQSQWFNFLEATSLKKQARAGYLPSVDLNVVYGKEDRDFDNRGDWFNQGQAEISLTQVLFDGFRIKNKVKQGDYAALKGYYELNTAVERKALEASQAYLDVQRYRELVKLAETNVANHQRVYNQINQRANQGVGNRADLAQIAGRLSLAQTNLMTERSNLNDVSERYARIVGQEPAAVLEPLSLDTNLPATRQDVVATAYANNNELKAALSEIEYARANAQEFKSNYYPKLSFVARSGLYQNRNSFNEQNDPDKYGQDSAVELRLDYNLFNGFADKAAYNAANARIAKAEDLKNKACIDMRQTASVAFNNVNNYNSQMPWLQRHRDEANAVARAYTDQFDIGRRSLLDVLDSENEAFQSNRSYTSAQYDLKIAQLQTLYSTGQLLPTLGVQRDNLPEVSEVSKREIDANNVCAVDTAAAQ
ncbi:TolC family outer membrane protein [Acinetobacter sp. YH12120]|uniref:TolC family outer membrane protein n=1 Tax=Acinetobacter sp. YH12120 TaxID=2601107 RepID=UPI0015D37373|nr:TolC family outer membrane protein [Acinetobacter sp. YH12120]